MAKTIDYYFTPGSPWSYFGHDRFAAIAARHGAVVNVLPVDLCKVFPVSGGLPLPKRAPQRQAYRLVELARWRDFLGLPINIQPRFAASGADLANRWIAPRLETGWKAALDLAGAVHARALGRRARHRGPGHAGGIRPRRRPRPGGRRGPGRRARNRGPTRSITTQAIDAQVFGVPWYVYAGEPFWGQDRLDFLDRALAK